MKKSEYHLGVLSAGFSYLIWGLLPIYWKLLGKVSSDEILANRVVWSFFFMLVLLVLSKKMGSLRETFMQLWQNKKQLFSLILASILISGNWFIYIWAVNNNHMIEASLGYYINPLVSVILGMLILKEKMTLIQYVSFLMAAIGVLVLTLSYGSFPWVSLSLALSFGLYGLAKKMIKVDSAIGLTLETMFVTPIGLLYMAYLFAQGNHSFLTISFGTDLLLIGAGVATATPLLYFAKGAQRIPLSTLGFLQYIAPTISLLLGVFVYGEHFSKSHLLAFVFIWTALTIYSLSKTKLFDSHLKRKKELSV
ncbi:EamA family transporter RarD [Bacillus sp. CGMCC 1.16607]|uniref:EamA family transporter RarD n=1 Tax=Bacillus sp. CGMCC 1.16607 TaxID=3351842 RepID=UPI0036358550